MPPIAVTLTRLSPARFLIAGLLAAIVLVSVASAAENNPARTRPKAQAQAMAQVMAQRVIVKFRQVSRVSTQATTSGESAVAAAVDTARMSALASRARITVKSSRALGANMHVMQIEGVANNETAAETLARLRADSDVEFAELDRPMYSHATSNDPLALVTGTPGVGQWYLANAQPSAINAYAAWDNTKGSNGVIIAVIDTGVLFDHPDLLRASGSGKLLPGYDFVSPDSANTFTTANDSDGRDANPADPGDFCNGDGSSWHGTRVSGIIGALTNNGAGVAGINWNGYILPVRVLGRCGGFNSDVVAGIRWAAGLSVPGVPTNPYPAQVINISLGGEGSCDAASASVISEASAAGVLVVVSAGNEGGPVDSPANCPGAAGIVGIRHAGTKVGFSSLGPQIALAAPGGNCVNIGAGQPCLYSIDTTSNTGSTSPGTNTYTNSLDFNVGTSFSSPIVSGIAGLMLAVNGNLKSSQLMARLKESANPFPTTSETGVTRMCQDPAVTGVVENEECVCSTAVCGAGMANANGAVNAALRPIAAISAPATFGAGTNVNLSGTGSGAACGRTISSYSWAVGSTSISTTSAAVVQAPASGSTVVRLTVTDDAGRTDFADITINPTSSSTSAPANAGTKACLTAIATPVGVTITATDADAAEVGGDAGTFTVTRGGSTTSAITVSLAIAGSATNGTDYQSVPTTVTIAAGAASATITVTPIDDTLPDGTESVVATIQPGTGYEVGSPGTATVTIADDEVGVSITASDANAAEASADPGVFVISRTGSTTAALNVALALSGTASLGTDYVTITPNVTIPAGSTNVTLTVTPIDDTTVDTSETVVLAVLAGPGYTLGTPTSATVTIADNDTNIQAPPANNGGGGGGAFDPLTLVFGLAFVVYTVMRRKRLFEVASARSRGC